MFAEQVAIQCIVGVIEKDLRAAIATQGHVMRVTGKYRAAKRAMGSPYYLGWGRLIKCTVTGAPTPQDN